ncbi:Tim22-complex subunit TIM54 Ecym_6299 [Eremothecium cymbalariae DBVPG|uniref:Mitochondrial import inner membrane translocase subunit TIM54 n=1 Tax=Eremothecium cymbalariae (strain CBS 270.75 / DBVPG 7215 / KCTC 17166 / NRRL Y-17582) TaxID=931890 RepID=G8JU99_ERECY|nr:hypothetical protein Ecym_6299 [Eremothecium cymbalariae DBVPG\
MTSKEGSSAITDGAKRAGYSNPAFKAMGIPTLRLPGRNWMIFWAVLSAGVSGVVYDKYQQRQISNKYINMVQQRSLEHMDTWMKPRKITVFVAPPPSDYLDTSLKVWRRYLKSILYNAGVDYEIITEERQGLIRFEVAERIRRLRREILDTEARLKKAEEEQRWVNRLRSWWLKERISEEEAENLKAEKYRKEFTYKQLLGVFYKNDVLKAQGVVSEDVLVAEPVLSGGVICIGRGAYKEYISGIHEGILGPLEAPQNTKIAEPFAGESRQTSDATVAAAETTTTSTTAAENVEIIAVDAQVDSAQSDSNHASDNTSDGEGEKEESTKSPPAPYISYKDYANAELPRELSSEVVKDPLTNVPALFHQPILVVQVPNLVGFLQIPKRIYRFYTRRYYAEQCCKAATSMVFQYTKPFNPETDLDLAKSEEEDWPNYWVKQGHERQSEWVQELYGDNRVLSSLHLIDPSKLDVQQVEN